MSDDPAHGAASVATRKAHGIPIWAYGAGIAAVFLVYRMYSNRGGRSAKTPAIAAGTTGVLDTSGSANALPGGLNLGGQTMTDTSHVYTTDATWLAAALTHVQHAGEDPIHSLAALNRFLNEGTLNAADQQVVNAAVSAIGLPPGYGDGLNVGTLGPSNSEIAASAAAARRARDASNASAYAARQKVTKATMADNTADNAEVYAARQTVTKATMAKRARTYAAQQKATKAYLANLTARGIKYTTINGKFRILPPATHPVHPPMPHHVQPPHLVHRSSEPHPAVSLPRQGVPHR